MQVQDYARARGLRRLQRARTERRVDVVGVHDARLRALDRGGDLLGAKPAADEPERRVGTADRRRVALEHLDLLAQVLADQPREILDRPLLPARVAIAVVQQQDHGLQG